ncbi:B12-binding domain-containing radical SAM protein [Patescibacteria group bacterium]
MSPTALRVVLLKPSKYGPDGAVERFRRGFMPNATQRQIECITPAKIGDVPVTVHLVDEYVQTNLNYLELLRPETCSLLALVGVQSHQFHRALDLAALAHSRGVRNVVMGGPHPMTCVTEQFQRPGMAFSLSEAEVVWETILEDALAGEVQPVYGAGQRWQHKLVTKPLLPPSQEEMRHYAFPFMGVYPARGCTQICDFCSVTEVAGRIIRSEAIEVTLASLRAAKQSGVKMIMLTSDNLNKIPGVHDLLRAIIAEDLGLEYFVECDAQVHHDEELFELLGRAGCFDMFVGAESFDTKTLKERRKTHNRPEVYAKIVRLCEQYGIAAHFSNIIGFPGQTAADVREHLRQLIELNPMIAWFYILSPFPGTVLYNRFLAEGLIDDENLDRFDATTLVWQHENLSRDDLQQLLFQCYREYYDPQLVAARVAKPAWERMSPFNRTAVDAFSRFSYGSAKRGIHPMSGGVGIVRLDRAQDYADLRRKHFGIDLAPLPENLPVSTEEAELMKSMR